MFKAQIMAIIFGFYNINRGKVYKKSTKKNKCELKSYIFIKFLYNMKCDIVILKMTVLIWTHILMLKQMSYMDFGFSLYYKVIKKEERRQVTNSNLVSLAFK